MEQVIENSNRLRNAILPEIESIVDEYREVISSRKQKLESSDRSIESEELHLQSLESEVESEESEIAELKHRISDLEKEISDKTSALDANPSSDNLKNKLFDYEKLSMDLTRALAFYQNRLGLSIKKLPNADLRLSFEYIKPEIDGTEHTLTISIGEVSKLYRVVSCTPVLPQISELVAVLNQTNDFSRFVKNLRKCFVGLYK